jgi:hypothetical protein
VTEKNGFDPLVFWFLEKVAHLVRVTVSLLEKVIKVLSPW